MFNSKKINSKVDEIIEDLFDNWNRSLWKFETISLDDTKEKLNKWKDELEKKFNSKYSIRKEENFEIYDIEVPGFDKNELKIKNSKGILTINGEKKSKNVNITINIGESKLDKVKLELGILSVYTIPAKTTDEEFVEIL